MSERNRRKREKWRSGQANEKKIIKNSHTTKYVMWAGVSVIYVIARERSTAFANNTPALIMSNWN